MESINNVLTPTQKLRPNWKGLIAAVSLITFSTNVKAENKLQPLTEWQPTVQKSGYEIASTDTTQLITIKGKLIDNDDRTPIAGVTIRLKGGNRGTVTNVNGDFSLQVPASSILLMSFIGYQTQEFEAVKFAGAAPQTVCLRGQMVMLGEPAIVYRKPPLHKRVINKIKRIF